MPPDILFEAMFLFIYKLFEHIDEPYFMSLVELVVKSIWWPLTMIEWSEYPFIHLCILPSADG